MSFVVRFQPEERTFLSDEEISLAIAAQACDILIEQPCGSRGTCGKCRVLLRTGASIPTPSERQWIAAADLQNGWRLACQVMLDGDALIEVPLLIRTLAAKGFGGEDLFANGIMPAVRKNLVQFDTTKKFEANFFLDALRSEQRLKQRPIVGPEQLSQIETAIQQGQRKFSVVVEGNAIVALESGDTTAQCYGLALDLGSTSVAGALVDLKCGDVLAEASELNPQIGYGADIIARIHFAETNPNGLAQLQEALRSAVNRIIQHLIDATHVERQHIYSAMVAGNPTMLHTLRGVEITSLGHAPYLGAWTQALTLKSRELRLDLNENANVHLMPMIRSHVGGDTVAAMTAVGMDQSSKWKLLIDLGTNSEVVLGCRDRMVATSTAAGPAFEGATIRHGMRAAAGAIEAVYISRSGRITVKTIDHEPARGICGTGLIDAVAELLRVGLVTSSGYFKSAKEFEGGAFPELKKRIVTEDGQRAVILAATEQAARGEHVMLTAHDVRQLQLVKGSILAGMQILCRHFGLRMEDIDEVLLAGAFGNYIRKASALAIGLVPLSEIDPERIRFVGNAAGMGARLALVDQRARKRAEKISKKTEYVELAGHPDYEHLFAQSMAFPTASRTQ